MIGLNLFFRFHNILIDNGFNATPNMDGRDDHILYSMYSMYEDRNSGYIVNIGLDLRGISIVLLYHRENISGFRCFYNPDDLEKKLPNLLQFKRIR